MTNDSWNEKWLSDLEKEINKLEAPADPNLGTETKVAMLELFIKNFPNDVHTHKIRFYDHAGNVMEYRIECALYDALLTDMERLVKQLHTQKLFEESQGEGQE